MNSLPTPIHSICLLASCLIGCSTADGSLPPATVSDSAGVTIVENRGALWTNAGGWAVADEPSVVIGVLDGEAEYQLYGVTATARQSDGTILVVDASRRVRRYDPSGRFLGEFGGEGTGPGEFIDPAFLLVSAGDSIDVGDVRLSRVTRFGPTGALVRSHTLDFAEVAKSLEPTSFPAGTQPLPDGRVLVRLVDGAGKGGGKVAALRARGDVAVGVSRTPSGAVILTSDLATVVARLEFLGSETSPLPASAGSFPVAPAQAKETVIAADPAGGRICLGEQSRAEVTCVHDDGGRTSIRWESAPGPVTPGEIENWLVTTIDSWDGKTSDDESRRLLLEVVQPTQRPAYRRLIIDHTGNLWVELNPPDRSPDDPTRFLLFDRAGTQLGEIVLPPVEVMEIGGDYVLGLHRDDLGIESVRLYPLTKPVG